MANKPAIDVFISSTCLDLADTREELRAHLESHGMTVRLSENPQSAFGVDPTADTIEICFKNILASRAVVIVVDRRYGTLLREDFPDYGGLSATHAEVKFARSVGKEAFYFVRDTALSEVVQVGHNTGYVTKWIDGSQSSLLAKFVEYIRGKGGGRCPVRS